MKVSAYNYFVYDETDNIYLGYNGISGGLYVFTPTQYEEVNKILENPDRQGSPEIVKEKLVKGRFLITDDLNEIQLLKLRNNTARYSTTGLGLVITPTLNCNFNCPYCYVDRGKINMDRPTIDKVKIFFEKKLETVRKIEVCWTGGEPLLTVGTVEELNSFFVEKSRDRNIPYFSSLISNGYLLTPEIVGRLKNCGIKLMQITLDGHDSYHDRYRSTITGEKTYWKILKNVADASNNNLKIILRSNIEKENYESIYTLIDDLANSGMNPDNVLYAPCMVKEVRTKGGVYRGTCLTRNEFSEIEPKIMLYALERGIKINKEMLAANYLFCGANSLSFFVIDAHANVLKCWCNLGRGDGNKIGTINNSGEIQYSNFNNLIRWMSWDPFEIKECLECRVLPICLGGCMYYNVMGDTEEIGIGCSTRKLNIEAMMKLYYLYYLKNKDIQA
ncbi:MAG: radical SAM protein [Candidatus Omnitrophota bacterium]